MHPSYEQRVLTWLQHTLFENDSRIGESEKQIIINELQLEEKGGENEIILLFRVQDRPSCTFGFRALAHEPTPQFMPDGQLGDVNDPEGWAAVIRANFYERINAADKGLPEKCEEKGITWC